MTNSACMVHLDWVNKQVYETGGMRGVLSLFKLTSIVYKVSEVFCLITGRVGVAGL